MTYTNGQEVLSRYELQDRLNQSFPLNEPPEGWDIYYPPEPIVDLTTARLSLKARLLHQVGATIVAGFTSNVLGSNHVYPLSETDQTNMLAIRLMALSAQINQTEFTDFIQCYAEGETKSDSVYKEHTAEQIVAVTNQANLHKQTILLHFNRKLKPQIDKARSVADLDLIVW